MTKTTGFDKALSSFREYAAQVLGTKPGKINVAPLDEAGARSWQAVPTDTGAQVANVGGAWAFEGARQDGQGPLVRGWALGDGTVVTVKQDLGLLLREAGVFSDKLTVPAEDLARRMIWSLGPGYRLLVSPVPPERPAPVLKRDPDGGGVFTFFVAQRPPGPGTLEFIYQCTIHFSADRKAEMKLSENLNR